MFYFELLYTSYDKEEKHYIGLSSYLRDLKNILSNWLHFLSETPPVILILCLKQFALVRSSDEPHTPVFGSCAP